MTKKIASASFTTVDVVAPVGVTAGGFVATLMLGGVAVGIPAPVELGASATFTITEPGTYTIEVARVSDSGENMASPASSAPFVVEADILMISVPLAVTVTLSDAVEVPGSVAVAVA